MPVNHICALDIGTSKIAGCVVTLKNGRIWQIYLESMPLKGVHKGSVIDSLELVSSVSRIVKSLKQKSGLHIKSLHTNISGQDIVTKHSRAIIPLAERGNKVITQSDIQKVNEQASILGSSLEEEIIHKIPFSYSTDSKSNIVNPVGLYSHKLEVDLYLICSKLASLQSFIHAVNQAGYDVKDVSFSGLATSEIVLNKNYGYGVNIVCDIGSDVTELLIFKDGVLRNIEILSIGGNDLTKELGETLKIPFDFAEDIKISYGIIGDAERIKEAKEILIKKDGVYEPIKQKLVSEIITAKAKSLSGIIKDSIERNLACREVNNLIVCGRTILQEGLLELLESSLGIPAQLGRILSPVLIDTIPKHEALSGHSYITYLTSLGVISLLLRKDAPLIATTQQEPIRNPAVKLIRRVKDIYQEYF